MLYYYFAKSYVRSAIARAAFYIAPVGLGIWINEWALGSIMRDNEWAVRRKREEERKLGD